MLATSTMYNPAANNNITNVVEEGVSTSYPAMGAVAPLHATYPRNNNAIHVMRHQMPGGGLANAPIWQQQPLGQAAYPSQMNVSQMQMQYSMNAVSNNQFLQYPYQQQMQPAQTFMSDYQAQYTQPHQQHAFMPATSAFTPTQVQQQSTTLMVPQTAYPSAVPLPQRPAPAALNPAVVANTWNPSMAMPDPTQMAPAPAYYTMPQDTPQTQQAIALQKAALQQQMQLAYDEAQQFEQQIAVKQHLRAQTQPQGTAAPTATAPAPKGSNKLSPRQSAMVNTHSKKRKALTFPEKFMAALMEHETDEDIVAWLPDGKSFVIVSPELFVQQVLAPVFKHSKYASFVRKLHRWGFQRLTSGTGTDCFHHPLFQRNRKDLASKISCAPREAMNNGKPNSGSLNVSIKGISGLAPGNAPPSLAGVEKFVRLKPMETIEVGLSSASSVPVSAETSCATDMSAVTASPSVPFVVHHGQNVNNSAVEQLRGFDNDGEDDASVESDSADPGHTGMLKRTLVHALAPAGDAETRFIGSV